MLLMTRVQKNVLHSSLGGNLPPRSEAVAHSARQYFQRTAQDSIVLALFSHEGAASAVSGVRCSLCSSRGRNFAVFLDHSCRPQSTGIGTSEIEGPTVALFVYLVDLACAPYILTLV